MRKPAKTANFWSKLNGSLVTLGIYEACYVKNPKILWNNQRLWAGKLGKSNRILDFSWIKDENHWICVRKGRLQRKSVGKPL